MTLLFVILIVVASVVLGLIVLVQNPKGGGLAGNIAGFSTQFMGVKQTTDVLEKGTWIFAGIIGVLCLLSSFFISGKSSTGNRANDAALPTTNTPVQQSPLQVNPGQNPAPAPAPANPAPQQ